jgi:hypothetical protein
MNHRVNRPQRVVKIQCYCADVIHVYHCSDEIPAYHGPG